MPQISPLRLGVIDIGSNSVRMVIFDGATRCPATFFNEKVMCGLGRDLGRYGRLHPEGRKTALRALRRFQWLAEKLEVDFVEAVATAAAREAEDGAEFIAQIARETGLQVRILDGLEEAEFAARGVLLGAPDARGIVADIGGASIELVSVGERQVKKGISLPLGALRLMDYGGETARLKAHLDKVFAKALNRLNTKDRTLYVVGGGWRAFAKADMTRRQYPLRVLQEYRMTPDDVKATARLIYASGTEDLQGLSEASLSRAETLPVVALALQRLIKATASEEIIVSAFGLREGVVSTRLSPELMQSDPLLQMAAHSEARLARSSGFGEELAQWIRAATQDLPDRLRTACCLLSDCSWRVSRDYRAQAAINETMRLNAGNLKHSDRVFIAAALAFRHKGGRRVLEAWPAYTLLSEARRQEAERLGRLMRLGTSLAAGAIGILPSCEIYITQRQFGLRVESQFANLITETVEKYAQSARKAFNLAEFRLKIR